MFSRRLDWTLAENRLATAIGRRRAAGLPLWDLTESNPTRAGLPYPAAAITAALGDPRAATYHPSPRGLIEARQAVADYYRGRDLTVDPERLFLAASTSEAYAWLFKLLCDPGDEVLVPTPSYPLFDYLAGLEAVRLVPYPLVYDGAWTIDLDELRRAITPRCRALLVVHPNNPTGSYVKRHEHAALVELAATHDLALIADEVFADYGLSDDPHRHPSFVDGPALSFTLSGLSKVVGLPQLKLAWLHIGGPSPLTEAAASRLELVADTYLSVGAPVQLAAARLLDLRRQVGGAIAARVRDHLTHLAAAVRGTAVELLAVEGGWYACLRLPHTCSDEQWALDLLEEEGVLVQPGYFFDLVVPGHAYVVVSLLTEPAQWRGGVARLLALAARR